VSESRLVIKPTGLPFDTEVLFGCALPTGADMILNELRPTVDISVMVLGLGVIVLAALSALKALDVSENKLSLAMHLGASHVFNSSVNGCQQAVLELTNGGASICVKSGGQVATIELGYSLIRKSGGRLLFASHHPEGEMIRLAPHEIFSGKQIAGTWGGATQPDNDITRMHMLFQKAIIPVDALLSKRYKLDQINDALADLEAGRVFSPLIVMEHPKEVTEV